MKGQDHLREFEDYLIVRDKSEVTRKQYRECVGRMLGYVDKDPDRIDQMDLDRYKVYMKQIYEDNTIIPHAAAINHFFSMLGKEELHVPSPSKVRKNVVPLTQREVEKLFAAARDDTMDHAIVTLLYYGMLRRKELINLDVLDIDFEREKLRINRGKGNRNDEVNIHPTALGAVSRYLGKRTEPVNGCDALFVSKYGTRLTKWPVYQRVKANAVKAGIKKRVYPHLLRHSCITHMSENGATLAEIQRQSRHKDIETLMGYIHPSEKKVREVYMRTVAIPVQQPQTIEGPRSDFLTDEQRERMLLDALCMGRISEDTYKTAMDRMRILTKEEDLSYFG